MLDYPILVPSNTHYDELEVGAEATTEEITAAKLRTIRELDAKKREVEKAICEATASVEGLAEQIDRVKHLERSADSSPTELAAERRELARLQTQAAKQEPRLPGWLAERDLIEREVRRANSLAIETPEKKLEYDRTRPPLQLLQLVDLSCDQFCTDTRIMLRVLRHDVSRAAEAEGVPVFHPSDLTRTDFSGDFVWQKRLDDDGSE